MLLAVVFLLLSLTVVGNSSNFSRVLLLLKRLAHYTEFLRLVVVSFGLALHLHTPYFPAQTAATRLVLLSVVASSMQQRIGFFFREI